MTLAVGCRNTSNQGNQSEETIMVFAAASLTDVLSEIIDSFEVQNSIQVQVNLASSGTLARQISQGEIPQVYISASERWVNYIDSLGFISKGYQSNIAQNSLVLIAPAQSKLSISAIDSSLNIPSIIGTGRLSIGDPLHVPAGKYAKQALEYYGLYESIQNKILPAKDVRSALMVVEMNESPLGIVYKTDALKSEKVKLLQTFPAASHQVIAYVAAACDTTEAGKKFFAYLSSKETDAIWGKYGFKK